MSALLTRCFLVNHCQIAHVFECCRTFHLSCLTSKGAYWMCVSRPHTCVAFTHILVQMNELFLNLILICIDRNDQMLCLHPSIHLTVSPINRTPPTVSSGDPYVPITTRIRAPPLVCVCVCSYCIIRVYFVYVCMCVCMYRRAVRWRGILTLRTLC